MKFQAALIVAAGNRVGIVLVQPNEFSDPSAEEQVRVLAGRTLGVERIVIMMLDENDVPTYIGSKEEVVLLADADFTKFPWEDYASVPE